MSKRKPMDKVQARERRNQLLESAAAAKLSLTEGVREMRTISGMTQEEFAQHRGVSARVIKAIELGQGNPTVATLNRIGEFFGLEVAFVPVKQTLAIKTGTEDTKIQNNKQYTKLADHTTLTSVPEIELQERIVLALKKAQEVIDWANAITQGRKKSENMATSAPLQVSKEHTSVDSTASGVPTSKKRKSRLP